MKSRSAISHIGIAVADLDKAMERYNLLIGDEAPEIEQIADQEVKVALYDFDPTDRDNPNTRLELIAPTSDNSPVARFLKKRGEGLHHLCLYVDNLEEKLSQLKQAGCRLIDEQPRRGAGGKLIAFVHPESFNGVLIELQQR